MVILLAEDEPKIADFIKRGLEQEHYTVEIAPDGEEVIARVNVNDYDLVILDVMLPKKDGLTVCKEMREGGLKMPILMLTARSELSDKVTGLNLGADDYMAKPFALEELVARVQALTRRAPNIVPNKMVVGDLVLDTSSHEVMRKDRHIKLTSKEFRILKYLMRNAGTVCSRTMLNEHIWGFNYVKSNIIDVYMSRLRTKIDGENESPMIVTIHGSGYKLKKE